MHKQHETEMEVEAVIVQAKLFASFREQLEDKAARYHDQGKSKLEEILLEDLHSGQQPFPKLLIQRSQLHDTLDLA